MISSKRETTRLLETNDRRILDSATRKRRLQKQLDALEQDNFQEDPHANITWHKKAPKFEDANQEGTGKKKRKHRGDHFKVRFRKTFQALLDEERAKIPEEPNYFSIQAPPSKFPARHFCAVCGNLSDYTCVQCGSRFCCLRCLGTHKDTRCLKYAV